MSADIGLTIVTVYTVSITDIYTVSLNSINAFGICMIIAVDLSYLVTAEINFTVGTVYACGEARLYTICLYFISIVFVGMLCCRDLLVTGNIFFTVITENALCKACLCAGGSGLNNGFCINMLVFIRLCHLVTADIDLTVGTVYACREACVYTGRLYFICIIPIGMICCRDLLVSRDIFFTIIAVSSLCIA